MILKINQTKQSVIIKGQESDGVMFLFVNVCMRGGEEEVLIPV